MDLKSNATRGAEQSGNPPAPRLSSEMTGRQIPVHEVSPGKKFCEAGPEWCRVCEKMSDIPVLRSEDLLHGRREVLIVHGEEVYRLLCTKNNKLILQK